MVARCWIWGALLLAGATSACGDDASGLFVTLKTDFVPGVEFVSATTELFEAVPRDVETSRRFAEHPAVLGDDFVAGRRIADLDSASGTKTIRVSLRGPRGELVARRVVRIEVRRRTSSVVVITRDCRGITCPDGRTCNRGACVDVGCSPEMPEACGPAECTDDSMCAPAAACAAGTCNEDERTCLSAPGACPPGQWCNPDVGCEPLPTFPDAGPPDGGPPPIDAGPPPPDTGPSADTTPPNLIIDAIADPRPPDYDATVAIAFSFRCDDGGGSGCDPGSLRCAIGPVPVDCSWSALLGGTGTAAVARFGDHELTISIADFAGNGTTRAQGFTVTRCARDLQYPNRTSSGFRRGDCCAGLTDAVYRDGDLYSGRSDGSCRFETDHQAGQFERTFDGVPCAGGLVEAAVGGCVGASARRVCLTSTAQAQGYCGTDTPSGSVTPMHTRIDEGWHVGLPCQAGFTTSDTTLMRRAGAENVCWGSVDRAHERWAISSSESCDDATTRHCRTDPAIPGLECVCTAGPHPYTDDGRG